MNCAETDECRIQYLRAVFDAIPQPAFVVDGDVRILDFNAAAELFLGEEPASALHQRGGEAFHCIHAQPQGCGRTEFCKGCVIRNSVNKALSGKGVCRELHLAELRAGRRIEPIDLLVTTSLLPYTSTPRVLLILEDIRAILNMRPHLRQSRRPANRKPGKKAFKAGNKPTPAR